MSTGTNPLSPEQFAAAEQSAAHEGYLHRVIKGIDEELNVITGGNLGQSLSSRIGLDATKGDKPAEILAKALDVAQPNHPVKAEVADLVQAERVVVTEEASPDLPKESEPAD